MTWNSKYKKLKKLLSSLPKPLVVAYSGGVDSTFLLYASVSSVGKQNVVAITADSPTYQKDEKKFALSYTRKLGTRHIIIKTTEMDDPHFYKNPIKRCYYCKNELFSTIKKLISHSSKINRNATIIYGATLSDENDFRPGMQAAHKWKIRAPLKETGFTKSDIRRASRALRLPTQSKPAQPCLASRFPYGEKITNEKIQLIARAEEYLRKNIPAIGNCDIRVRYHSTPTQQHCARIEIAPHKKIFTLFKHRSKIIPALKKIGFSYISVDIEGFRTGSANEFFRRKT